MVSDTQTVDAVDPQRLERNPENPRLIFRADELEALEESIRTQGVLVPLTVYRDGRKLVILDGERRWRCAIKLSLSRVPVIVQPKPDRLRNIMMMFAIHNARTDWDPLPTAYKLQELELEFETRQGRTPREAELAEIASLSRGEVRRLKKLLALPEDYRQELMKELEKPRSSQVLTVDLILETTRGVAALAKRGIIEREEEETLSRALVDKYRRKVEINTVAPRQLARIARAVERDEIPIASAKRVAHRLITSSSYSIQQAFEDSAAQADFEHSVDQLIGHVEDRLNDLRYRGYELSPALLEHLRRFRETLDRLLDS